MAKQFNIPKYQDFEIKENGAVVGTLRVKANAISWSPKGKQSWFSVKIEKFGEFAEKTGSKKSK